MLIKSEYSGRNNIYIYRNKGVNYFYHAYFSKVFINIGVFNSNHYSMQ